MKTTVIFHSADYDGIFCREIARKFLPDAELIGWDFSDKPIKFPDDGTVYVLDLPVDRVFGFDPFSTSKVTGSGFLLNRVIWIDHHKSSIESHPTDITGYRIDGVAACRLAWQWFAHNIDPNRQTKAEFLERKVSEPLAVRLVGEYDVWDHRGDGDLEFQFGLDSEPQINWGWLLDPPEQHYFLETLDDPKFYTEHLIRNGKYAMQCYAKRDADVMRSRSFMVEFEGLKFLALNTPRCNSQTFLAKDVPATGHDALMAFFWNGNNYVVSLYHAAHNRGIDLSQIAVKYGGGGHRGACGFTTKKFPFINP